jgi:hypothetical protein
MAKRNRDGKYIIPAGEVGVYSLCPEQWRLSLESKQTQPGSAEEQLGRELHKTWAAEIGEISYLRRSAWLMVGLVLTAIVFYMLLPRS